MTTATRRGFVESLARRNRKYYGTEDGDGTLRALDLTFEHRWIYVFELIQNALDVGARCVALRRSQDGTSLIFQHDGGEIREPEVEALSKVFRSTKGATTVGFMGIGFKSVFGRFREARISGWGWTFRYEMRVVTGETYGDVHTDPLGAVIPIWDEHIADPEAGFTTRFELRGRIDENVDLLSDLARLLPEGDLTLLAILASSGLKRLYVDDRVWRLDIKDIADDGNCLASASCGDRIYRWRLFPVDFTPSREAIRRFLEHRKIRPAQDERDKVYAGAARPRRVLGVLPLDVAGIPLPPTRARIYATLPTEVTLPIGLHINADWLLNISRTGLREIEDDPWQREIVDRIPEVLLSYLRWAARTFSEPDAARAAFNALAAPSPELGGLDAILSAPRWLSRLRDLLQPAEVIPAWAEDGKFSFVAPQDAVVPPAALATAFEREPSLRPATLLKGPVLVSHVLGSGGRELMDSAGLLTELSPQRLKELWAGGLGGWWEGIADDEPTRRDLLFHLWAAVSELTSENPWSTTYLPCVRTAHGTWRSVTESAYFTEPLPSDRETGGNQIRQFIQSFIDDTDYIAETWIHALRQGARMEKRRRKQAHLSQALEWLEWDASSVGLRELVEKAISALAGSSRPNWSVLVPLGQWTLRRNRHDLLVRVLVQSERGPCGVPPNDALVSRPYVPNQNRELLFPGVPLISGEYLDDPETADPAQWRTFFKQAGVRGPVSVAPIDSHARQGAFSELEEFLGEEVERRHWSNVGGYTLRDFDIEPALPEPHAPEEHRGALSSWLQDDSGALRNKGRRQIKYSFHGEHTLRGAQPSTWLHKLSALAWVPCDGELRRPQDVLPRNDPARTDAPFAELTEELVAILDNEGLKFGGAIPAATSLQRFLTLGPQPTAEELVASLREIRTDALEDADRSRFREAVCELDVPTEDGEWIPISRIVRSIGGRKRRGSLGGWIAPLVRLQDVLQAEFLHADFPHEFPETTTGEQALDYLVEVWQRTLLSPERLANEVRDILPAAYAYCLEDRTSDPKLQERWEVMVADAVVFADREWFALADTEDLYFDDVGDRRFIPETVTLRTVTAGHLGNSLSDQLRAAKALGLPLLSSAVTMNWSGQVGTPVYGDWVPRFELICELLWSARSGERADSESRTNPDIRLEQSQELALQVSLAGGVPEWVPVHARMNNEVLTVAGRPARFGADAAKELLRHFAFRQRADLAADLTGMLMAIDVEEDFQAAADKCRRAFTPDFALSPTIRAKTREEDGHDVAGSEHDPPRISVPPQPSAEKRQVADQPTTAGTPSAGLVDEPAHPSDGESEPDSRSPSPTRDVSAVAKSSHPSFSRTRALARQNALAKAVRELRSSLEGEIAPMNDDEITDEEEDGVPRRDGSLGDEVYRRIAAQYERDGGRSPEIGKPGQTGWDLRSVDPKTGAERLIEVKGKGCPWVQDEVVELSRAQVREAFESRAGQARGCSWYLYVVERTEKGDFRVLPIENPVQVASKWILSGQSWREIAVEPRRITIATNGPEE